jgi:hypothetical protein
MLMAGTRSRMNEASPVVTGRADDATASVVFPNWREDTKLQDRFNPFLELEEAARLRDAILHRFVLKPGHLVGDVKERGQTARSQLASDLYWQRRWGREQINAYLGIEMTDAEWKSLRGEVG